MNTKRKQPKKAQSEARKPRDLQAKKNPKGGTLLNTSAISIIGQSGGNTLSTSAQGG